MDPSDVTVPRVLSATCINCEDHRNFKYTGGDSDELVAEFRCVECNHKAEWHIDPE